MRFEEKLANLVADEFCFPGRPPDVNEIISALELQIMALREEHQQRRRHDG